MKEKTLFITLLGNSPKVRVLDVLITGRELDYCISDLSEEAEIGRATFYKMLNYMLKEKIIIPTRKFGRMQLYKLNLKNIKVKALVQLYDKLIFEESEKEIQRQMENKRLVREIPA